MTKTAKAGVVAVIGAGLVGRSWAVCFARSGRTVRIYDSDPAVVAQSHPAILGLLAQLDAQGLLREPALLVAARIVLAGSLEEALSGAVHVQENAPERLEIKRTLFARLDQLASPDAVLASSTSALLPSSFSGDLPGAARCLVAHPLNPPHLIPAVEIVPSPKTSDRAVHLTRTLLLSAGQMPILARREVEGFIMNRLQGAILDEAFSLVEDGYATVEDVAVAVRDGLARRWTFMGPFETIDLNAPDGVQGFVERYGPAYAAIGAHRPGRALWRDELARDVIAALRARVRLEDLPDRASWRDGELAALAAHLSRRTAGE